MRNDFEVQSRTCGIEKSRKIGIHNPDVDTYHGKSEGVYPSVDFLLRESGGVYPRLDTHLRIYHGMYQSLECQFRKIEKNKLKLSKLL